EELERQLLKDAAASANAKFHAFFEQGALLAGIMETDGTMIDANHGATDASGYTREHTIGKPFWDGPWWAPSQELRETIRVESARAATGQIVRAETPYFMADGTERVADLMIQPIRNEHGQVQFLASTAVDITDRKRAEAEREKFVTVIENSSDFIAI